MFGGLTADPIMKYNDVELTLVTLITWGEVDTKEQAELAWKPIVRVQANVFKVTSDGKFINK